MKRRKFLQASSAGVFTLMVGCNADDGTPTGIDATGPDTTAPLPDANTPDGPPIPDTITKHGINTWLEITTDHKITIVMSKAEMGQGVNTALPMIIADELDVPWEWVDVRLEGEMGQFHITQAGRALTSESGSVRRQYPYLRNIGAAARAMLVTAAAQQWNVSPTALKTEQGAVINSAGEKLWYGQLVEAASKLPVPEEPKLKTPAEFKIIGTSVPRVEIPSIVEGKHTFGIDVTVDGMKYGAIRHSPVLGGEAKNLETLDLSASKAEKVIKVPGAAVVISDSYWSANEAAKSLPIEFDAPPQNAQISSESIFEDLKAALLTEGKNAINEGDAAGALQSSAQVVKATYQVPFLAHACMEPMTATARLTGATCEVWLPTQGPDSVKSAVAKALGLKKEDVTVYPTYLGTGFGRKAETDYGVQAAIAAKETGSPVKLIWSREEDIQNDYYRPAFMVNMEGGIAADGSIVAWKAKSAGEGILADRGIKLPVDPLSVDGLVHLDNFLFKPMPYGIPNQRVDNVEVESPMRLGFWRSVGNSQNALFVESFLDELANAAQQDPMAVRQKLLQNNPRALNVMTKLAELASWGTPSTPGAFQGVAFCDAFGSWIGQVAEVSVVGKSVKIHKITSVVDCGQVISPDNVIAQIEGGAIYGIGAILNNEITLKDGRVQQTNFFDYPMPHMAECPEFQTYIMPSSEAPGGIGEVGVGPVGPAIANAIFAATGQRIREFPIQKTLNAA